MKISKIIFSKELAVGALVRYKQDPKLVGFEYPQTCVNLGIGRVKKLYDINDRYAVVQFEDKAYDTECTSKYLEVIG